MEKWVGFEVVAQGKMDDYKAWWEARNKRFQELGVPGLKMYRVNARRMGLVCFEGVETTPEDLEQWITKYQADEVIQTLRRERNEKKLVVEGTGEWFRLIID